MILAALRNDFSVDRVAQDLRNVTDDDVPKARSRRARHSRSVDQG